MNKSRLLALLAAALLAGCNVAGDSVTVLPRSKADKADFYVPPDYWVYARQFGKSSAGVSGQRCIALDDALVISTGRDVRFIQENGRQNVVPISGVYDLMHVRKQLLLFKDNEVVYVDLAGREKRRLRLDGIFWINIADRQCNVFTYYPPSILRSVRNVGFFDDTGRCIGEWRLPSYVDANERFGVDPKTRTCLFDKRDRETTGLREIVLWRKAKAIKKLAYKRFTGWYRGRLYVQQIRDGKSYLVALDMNGMKIWEKPLGSPYSRPMLYSPGLSLEEPGYLLLFQTPRRASGFVPGTVWLLDENGRDVQKFENVRPGGCFDPGVILRDQKKQRTFCVDGKTGKIIWEKKNSELWPKHPGQARASGRRDNWTFETRELAAGDEQQEGKTFLVGWDWKVGKRALYEEFRGLDWQVRCSANGSLWMLSPNGAVRYFPHKTY